MTERPQAPEQINIHERGGLSKKQWENLIQHSPSDSKITSYAQAVISGRIEDTEYTHRQYLGARHWNKVKDLETPPDVKLYAAFEKYTSYSLDDHIASLSSEGWSWLKRKWKTPEVVVIDNEEYYQGHSFPFLSSDYGHVTYMSDGSQSYLHNDIYFPMLVEQLGRLFETDNLDEVGRHIQTVYSLHFGIKPSIGLYENRSIIIFPLKYQLNNSHYQGLIQKGLMRFLAEGDIENSSHLPSIPTFVRFEKPIPQAA